MFKKFKLPIAILLLFLTQKLSAQNSVVTGTVRSADGESIPGVSILVKETKQVLATDAKGAFSISVADKNTLVFSYIGFQTQEVLVNKKCRCACDHPSIR